MNSADSLGFARARQVAVAWSVVLVLALIASAVAALCIGAVTLSPTELVGVISARIHQQASDPAGVIVWDVRAPRVLLGAVIGAALAVSGTVLQTMVRNPLADPHLLGINSGASAGAASAILFGVGVGSGAYRLQASAFVGALLASVAVYALARFRGSVSANRVILAGVAVGYALSALTSFLVFSNGDAEGARSVMFWLLGSLALARWDAALVTTAVTTLLSTFILIAWSRQLDVLASGDESARSLGVSPAHWRVVLLGVVSLLIGVAVASSGAIGFVGLVVPHLARSAVGARHRFCLSTAALMGATLLVLADLAARTVVAPQELPIGILTALVGTPFLIGLIRKQSH